MEITAWEKKSFLQLQTRKPPDHLCTHLSLCTAANCGCVQASSADILIGTLTEAQVEEAARRQDPLCHRPQDGPQCLGSWGRTAAALRKRRRLELGGGGDLAAS